MTSKQDADDDATQGRGQRTPATRRTFLKTAGATAVTAALGSAGAATAAGADGEMNAVSFDFTHIPNLSAGHYEGWAIYDDEKVSTGTFQKGGEYTFTVDRDLAAANEIAVTIEPDGDDDPAPSGVVVMAGAIEDGQAELSFPVEFSDASGSYILATPTNGAESDETSGIWFLDPSGGPSASLDLPSLAEANWTYEGWVVHGGMPISTGRFDEAAMADDAAPYSGDQGAPPFPGEDFLQHAPGDLSFPTDLTDGDSKAVVSVEPDVDGSDPTGPSPFAVKPLAGQIPADGTDHTSYDLQQTDGMLPGGTAQLMHGPGGSTTTSVTFEFSDLPELSMGHYEGWAIYGEEKVSTGKFSVGDEYTFAVDRDLNAADELVVTIEPDDDPDPAPSGVPILAGPVEDGTAQLSFPLDFGDASGSYILATPTNGGDSNETSGIWFLDPTGDGPSASLDLPAVPSGWTYEGWVVHEGQPITSGRFDDPAAADDAAPYSGDQGAPPFPGEDFLQNAPGDLSFPTDLTDGASKAVVSVEPDIDGSDPTGDGPFAIKPLAATIPGDGTDHTNYDLHHNAPAMPSAAATITDGDQTTPDEPLTGLTYDLSHLPTLDTGHYEGWAIFGSEKVSTGVFSSGGEHTFAVDRDLRDANKVVVTIEPDDDPDPAPSGVAILTGSVDGDQAELSFPVDFDDAMGSYILATPTNGAGTNETSGIWFLDPTGDEPSQSLHLPDLPGGWTYEGWVVHEGQPITTGRFDDPAAADDAAPYSGEMAAPPFPGEDFLWDAPGDLSFPTDLADGASKAVISVEPDIDGSDPTGPSPFAIKPLVGAIPGDAEDHTNYELQNTMAALPSGVVSFHEGGSDDRQTVKARLQADTVGRKGDATVDLSVADLPDGVTTVNLQISVSDPSVATIESISAGPMFGSVDAAEVTSPDGSTARLTATDVNGEIAPGDVDVALGSVTLAAQGTGATRISVDVDAFTSDADTSVATTTVADTLMVDHVAPIDGHRPTDVDGDGEYEDLSGNGQIDYRDVVLYFQHMTEPELLEYVEAYDYTGNDQIDYQDEIGLFEATME